MELGYFTRVIFGWAPERTLSDTAWLNGLRGLAAFLVMMSHYSDAFLSPMCEAPFGALVLEDSGYSNVWYFYKGQRLWAPWRLPILRVFMSNGGGQVAVFFVISGFVLTCGPLAESDYAKLYRSLGSSTLRRWSRLYLPCGIVSFIYLLVENFKHLGEGIGAFFGSIWEYLGDFAAWMNPFLRPAETVFAKMHSVNLVVWTIPYEFSGSIFVFVLVLCLGRIPFQRRIVVVIFVTIYALYAWHWELWLFGTGMALADYTRHSKLFTTPQRPLFTVLWSMCLTMGLTLLSFPSYGDKYDRPGYDQVLAVLPFTSLFLARVGADRLWWGSGASLIVVSLCHLRLGRRFFELPILQHLGKISFMLYLIHSLIGHLLGRTIQDAVYKVACTKVDDPTFGEVCRIHPWLNVIIIIGVWSITLPPLLVVSHVLETFVDRPVTRWSKKMDQLLVNGFFQKKEQHEQPEVEEEHLLGSSSSEDLEMEEISSETGRRPP